MHHQPDAQRLLDHLRGQYGIDPVAATRLSVHKTYVFRIDRKDGGPWVARAFPPARPRAGVEGDAAILRFLERQGYPAERLAVDDAVSDFDGSAVLVTRFMDGVQLPDGAREIRHDGRAARTAARAAVRRVRQPPGRGERGGPEPGGRARVRTCWRPCRSSTRSTPRCPQPSASGSSGCAIRCARPTTVTACRRRLLHGNLLHAPDHAVLSETGPVAINWKASGRGPRLADFAYLIWGTGAWNPRRPNQEWIDAAVNAYRRHVEPTDEELDRLEGVMYIRTLYLACFGYRRSVANGSRFNEWGFIEPPEYFSSTAAAVRAAFRR